MTTASLMPTASLIGDLDRAAHNLALGLGNGYRQEILGCRNKLRTRHEEIEERLDRGEQWFRDHVDDPSLPRHEQTWLDLLSEYQTAYDAAQRANVCLTGGTNAS